MYFRYVLGTRDKVLRLVIYFNNRTSTICACLKPNGLQGKHQSHAITDEELYRAILETEQGKADALGGSFLKSRLRQNRERAIILAKGGSNWFLHVFICKTGYVEHQ